MSSKVGIVSLGCPKNQVDAEMLLFTLKSKGFELVNDPADADAVIVNTCGFIESAKQESINEIIELGKLKQEGKIKAIIVTGCLAERYKNEITRQLYEVDAALGIGANSQIADVVAELLSDNTEHKEKIEEFPDKQQHVAHDAHDPGQPSICFAHRGVFGILRVADQPPHQKFHHRFMSSVGRAMDFCSIRMSLPLNL